MGTWRLSLLVGLAGLLVYVACALTPSSYGAAGPMLGIDHVRPVIGQPRAIRSDEWAVSTPYYQIAVASGLGPRDTVSPFHEPLRAFFALPSRDWSMAFTPDLWGFLVMDPAHAFSLHYALLAAAFLLGFAILLRQLGCTPGYALAVSALLFLSQFVQVWWTSNTAVLALAPWPFVAFLWRAPWFVRGPAMAYATAAWLVGQLYPPFIIAGGLGLAIAVLAFRPDALRPARLALAVGAAAVGVAIAWAHYAELIPVMSNTAYPGRRISDGGGLNPLQLLAHAFPYLTTRHYEPLPLWPSNACEVGVVGTLLPLALAVFADHGALWRQVRARPWAALAWAGGVAVLAAWMLAPIPGRFAPLLNLTPANRMLWGFGLALVIGLAVLAGRAPWRLTPLRIGLFLAAVAGAWAVSELQLAPPQTPGRVDWFDLVPAAALLILLAAGRRWPQLLPPRRLALSALLLAAALTFGRFNPVQSAQPIFARIDSPKLEVLRAYAQANPRRIAVVSGMYGAVLNGAGVPSLNHTLMQPQLRAFRPIYASLDAATFDEAFNRYEHLQPEVRWEPKLAQADLLLLPPDAFAIPLATDTAEAPPVADAPQGGEVQRMEAVRLGPRRWGVAVEGWFPWKDVRDGQTLRVALADPSQGRIVSARAYRLPRMDTPGAGTDPGAFASGFGVRLEIETEDDSDVRPDELRLSAVDPGRLVRALPCDKDLCDQASKAM